MNKRIILVMIFICTGTVQAAWFGAGRMVLQRSAAALRAGSHSAAVYTSHKIKEDPYAAGGAVVGAGTGFVLSGNGTVKTTAGTVAGAVAGYNLAKNRRDIKTIKHDVAWIREHCATKIDLSAAVQNLRQHVSISVDAGVARTRQSLRALMCAGKKGMWGVEARLGEQLKTAHTKLDQLLQGQKSGFNKVSDLWNKWYRK